MITINEFKSKVSDGSRIIGIDLGSKRIGIAISDGNLDRAELKLIKKRADKFATEDLKASTIVKKIIDETEESVSFYPSIKKINDTNSPEEKVELLKVLWELVAADSVIDPYEENLYFKIAELIQIKRSKANQIKHEVNQGLLI